MRIAFLSDIHGNLLALEAIIADLRSRKPDLVVNLGDCVSGPLWPKETCELLMSLNWPAVRGNCDREAGSPARPEDYDSDAFAWDRLEPAQRAWLAGLPKTVSPHPGILACHSTPQEDDNYLLDDILGGQLCPLPPEKIATLLGPVDARLITCGHSHVPRLLQCDNRLVLNPGSVGLPAYEAGAGKSYYVAESGSPHARYAIATSAQEGFSIEMIAVVYPHESAARQAEVNGRPDYAKALRTGTMR